MSKIARRSFLGSTLKVGALLPFLSSPAQLFAAEVENEKISYPATDLPDRIILNVTPDTSTSVTVNWRTATTTTSGTVEYAIASAHPEFVEQTNKMLANSKPFSFENIKAINHSITLNGLTPNTLYAYRVGNNDNWSEWFQFKTAKKNTQKAQLSFIYVGDAQVGIKPLWSRVLRKAYADLPEAQLVIHAGDLINRANKDDEWGDWFAAGNYIHSSVPTLMTPGNHEYTHEDGKPHLSVYWNQHFALPANGPANEYLKGSCYYTDLQGVRFISMNTQMVEEALNDACIADQVKFLHQTLKDNPQQWTCVVMHHPVFSTKKGRDNKKVREYFKPIFEQYGVDLVLQGHDHAYARGMNKIDKARGNGKSGTTYVVSVSGSKMYETEPMDWADIIVNHTQVYHSISINDGTLQFKAHLATGEIFDAFDLIKTAGKPNQMIDKRPK